MFVVRGRRKSREGEIYDEEMGCDPTPIGPCLTRCEVVDRKQCQHFGILVGKRSAT